MNKLFTYLLLPILLLCSGFGPEIPKKLWDIKSIGFDLNGTNVRTEGVVSWNDDEDTLWIGDYTIPSYLGTITDDPTGFVSTWQSDSVVAFDENTLTFSITSVAGAFTYYQDGVKFTSSGDTVNITDKAGIWYFYYDGATLTASQSVSTSDFTKTYVAVAVIYWDQANSQALLLGPEQHGVSMSGATHYHLHEIYGLEYEKGLTMSGYVLDDNADASIQFNVSAGEGHDEDLGIDVVDSDSPTAYWEQQLSLLSAPVMYKIGEAWTMQAPSTLPYVTTGTGRLAWNEFTGGAWQLTEVGNIKFVNQFLVLFNCKDYPIKMVLGEATYNTEAGAIAAAATEIVDIGSLIGPEATYLYVLTMQTGTAYAGTKKAKLVHVTDIRGTIRSSGGSASSGADHAALSNNALAVAGHSFTPDETAVAEDLNDITQDIYSSDSRKNRIDALGDSQTYAGHLGYDRSDFYSYVMQESDRDNSSYYINQGITGETCAQILTRYDSSVTYFYRRDASNKLFVQCGHNDALNSRTDVQFWTALDTIITQAVAEGFEVFVATVTPFDESLYDGINGAGTGAALNVFVDAYNVKVNALAVASGATIIDLSLFVSADGIDWDDESLINADGIHWGITGHTAIAGLLREYINQSNKNNDDVLNSSDYPQFAGQLAVSSIATFGTSITVDADKRTFSRGAGSFVTDGWERGDYFTVADDTFSTDFTNVENNAEHYIVNVTALEIQVSTADLVDETATVTLVSKRVKTQPNTVLSSAVMEFEASQLKVGRWWAGAERNAFMLFYSNSDPVNVKTSFGYNVSSLASFYRTVSGDLLNQVDDVAKLFVVQIGGNSAAGDVYDKLSVSNTAVTVLNSAVFTGDGSGLTSVTAANVDISTAAAAGTDHYVGVFANNDSSDPARYVTNLRYDSVTNAFRASVVNASTQLQIGGAAFTATPSEINQALDGINANVTDTNLNLLSSGSNIVDDGLHDHHPFGQWTSPSGQAVTAATASNVIVSETSASNDFSVSTNILTNNAAGTNTYTITTLVTVLDTGGGGSMFSGLDKDSSGGAWEYMNTQGTVGNAEYATLTDVDHITLAQNETITFKVYFAAAGTIQATNSKIIIERWK